MTKHAISQTIDSGSWILEPRLPGQAAFLSPSAPAITMPDLRLQPKPSGFLIVCLAWVVWCCSANAAMAGAPSPAPRLHQQLATLMDAGEHFKAEQLCRQILRSNPHDQAAYAALQNLSSQRSSVPASSKAYLAADSRLPQHFGLHQTPRFVLLSDADHSVTAEHGQWVERTYQEFERFAQRCGLKPLPLEHKLVCILFERRDEYQSFARSQDGVVSSAITGYYSPRHDRVVFSLEPDNRSRPRVANSRPQAAEGAREVLGFAAQAASGDAAVGGPASHHPDQQNGHCPSNCAAKCVHETIHQLMFHTRLMAPEVQYPLWVCEGLSTAFETSDPAQAFGPDHDFAPRRDVFARLLADGQMVSLSELVKIAQLPANDPALMRAVYHQGYALVSWMCNERPTQLGDYLRSMLSEPPGRPTGARHLELFERAFGSVDAVETQWLEHERAALSLASR